MGRHVLERRSADARGAVVSAEVPLHVVSRVARELQAAGDLECDVDRLDDHEIAVRAVIRELAVQGYEVRKAAA